MPRGPTEAMAAGGDEAKTRSPRDDDHEENRCRGIEKHDGADVVRSCPKGEFDRTGEYRGWPF